jgi:dipeptidase A
MACTTILVGKKASFDGSTMVARNHDSPSGVFTSKKFTVVQPEKQPRHYRSVLSHVEIELPDNPLRFTALPNALKNEGIWDTAGVNSEHISMTATETITSNERVLAADPLVKFIPAKDGKPEQAGGIGEEDMVTIVLPYIHSAREGVERLGALLEKYGTYEMNGIAFQDIDEIWWLETIGGHHWIAKKVPDNAYVVMPNQLGIDSFDLEDAFTNKKEHLCSADLREFIKDNYLNLSFGEKFNPREAFGSHSDADHVYNTPRAWFMGRYLNPKTYKWDGESADYRPDSDDIPWSFVPEKKVTVEDVKYVLSAYFQGTPYNCYGRHGDLSEKGKFRPIGINRNSVLEMTQLRPYTAPEFCAVEWLAFGSNAFNAFVPFYANIESTPEYFANTTELVTTDNFYWANRIAGALADAQFGLCSSHIERYQASLPIEAYQVIREYDKRLADKVSDKKAAVKLMEEANEKIADIAKKQTYELLNNVLYEVSCAMKNGFSRSDA